MSPSIIISSSACTFQSLNSRQSLCLFCFILTLIIFVWTGIKWYLYSLNTLVSCSMPFLAFSVWLSYFEIRMNSFRFFAATYKETQLSVFHPMYHLDVCFPLFWLDDSFRFPFLADWTAVPPSPMDQCPP